VWVELIRCLEKRELLPMVVFSFSKKKCDSFVDSLTAGLSLPGVRLVTWIGYMDSYWLSSTGVLTAK
jgi:hypothetical protein